jgi:toxin ParE1/3/4
VRRLRWTERARRDISAIRDFVSEDSPRYASAVLARLIARAEQIPDFPQSGRVVPEISDPSVREIIVRPYRIVYRLTRDDELHIITVHHSARRFPTNL